MWITTKHEPKNFKINTDFIAMLYPNERTIVMSSGAGFDLTEEDYGEIEAAMFPTRKKVAKDDQEMADFLTHLHQLTGGRGSALLSPKRKKQLQALLAIDGMTKDRLIAAATNIGKDKWLQGDNENKKRYGDIDYLLRPDKAVKWAEHTPEKRKMF